MANPKLNCWTCGAEFEPTEEIKFFTKKELYRALTISRKKGERGKERKKFYKEGKKALNCPQNCRKVIEYQEKLQAEILQSRRDRAQERKRQKGLEIHLQENLTRIYDKLDNHEKRIKQTETEQEKKKKHQLRRERFLYLEKKKWPYSLTKKEKERIGKAKSIEQLWIIADAIEENQVKIQKAAKGTIYEFNDWKYYIGWPAFLILAPLAIKKVRKINKKKPKPTATIQEEVQEKFNLWRLNMYLSVAVYFVSFFILKGAIDKWLRPNIRWLIEKNEDITVTIITGLLGFLFLADGYISSELKTPLQRLSIKIESTDISEKEKKSLLSKTQQANETFKETLKRFGLLSIVGMTIKLLGEAFDNNKFALICYLVPLGFGILRIWQVSRKIEKMKK